ncbi:MAG: alpha/beta hydrolase [Cyanobacteriota bacterium]|nr:alpha/beta hydrolase [Cyanobacteriota bacterium]
MSSLTSSLLPAATPPKAGIPLLYLPGMDGTGTLFYRQAEKLAADFCIRSLSLNGSNLDSWVALSQYVEFYLEEGSPAILCGESFGACLALQVAVRRPDLCAGLILVNPASSWRRGSWGWLARLLLPFVPEPFYHLASGQGLGWLAELSRIAPVDQQKLQQAVAQVPLATAAHRLALLSEFDVDRLPLEALQMPTLLVAGSHDRLLPSRAEVERLAHRLPNAAVAVAPASGHACLLEQDLNLSVLMEQHPMLRSKSLRAKSSRRPADVAEW